MQQSKRGLDEMQRANRDRIGNQCFILMSYLLLLDTGLAGFGVRWLDYPASTMVIVTGSMAVYLVRIISAHAYPLPEGQASRLRLVLVIVAAIAGAIVVVNRLAGSGALFVSQPDGSGGASAPILFIISAVALTVSLGVLALKTMEERRENREE